RRHTRFSRDWSSDVCSSDLGRIGVWGEAKGTYKKNGRPALASSARLAMYSTDFLVSVGSTSAASNSGAVGPCRVLPGSRPCIIEIGRATCRERVESRVFGGT